MVVGGQELPMSAVHAQKIRAHRTVEVQPGLFWSQVEDSARPWAKVLKFIEVICEGACTRDNGISQARIFPTET